MKTNNIQVALRKRPLLSKEIEKGNGAQVVEIANNKQINLLDPDEINKKYSLDYNINKSRFKETHFTFDYVFDEDATNHQVYQEVGQFYLTDVIEGFNTTIFAYGATAAGKTYTMVGQKDVPGLMDLVVEGLFEKIRQKEVTNNVVVRIAYMEIYNENIKDLLSPESKNLELREDPKSDVIQVHGLTEVDVTDPQQISGLLKVGSKNRSKDSTIANDASSRSHAIFQISIESVDKAEGLEKEIVISKMSLVDLAGSEKSWANKSKANKLEGAKINQSLLTLGNCIQALSEMNDKGSSRGNFIPYRGSKLTRLLKDSLGGNCRTVMIANISGSILSFEDTYNTLQYASRAKNIKVHVQKNIISSSNHVSNYAVIIEKLNKENENLRNILLSNHPSENKNITKLPQINPIVLPPGVKQSQSSLQAGEQLSENERIVQEQIEQGIKQQFDDEVGYIRTIQENQMKFDKIGRMNLQLQAEINKLASQPDPNNQSQQYKEQQSINSQGAQSLQQQIQDLSSKFKTLQDNRKIIQQKIKSSGLPNKTQLYLANLLSSGEMYSLNVEKQYEIGRQNERIREKEVEITELSEQLSLREKILMQQKSLIKSNNLSQQQLQNNSIYSKIKDVSIILSSIQATADLQTVSKRKNNFSNQSLHSNSIQQNLSPITQIKLQYAQQERGKLNTDRKIHSKSNVNDAKLFQVSKSVKNKRSTPNPKSLAIKNYTASSSPTGSHQGSRRSLLPQIIQKKKPNGQSDSILSQISPQLVKPFRKKQNNYSTIEDQSTANLSISDTNLSPKSKLPNNYYTNLVNKYQNHVYSISNLDADNQSLKSGNQTPKGRQKTTGNVQKALSQRNLPISSIKKNDYDVHQSPYVQQFKTPEVAATSRKTKLQQLNLNLDNLKELYTQKYYNNN